MSREVKRIEEALEVFSKVNVSWTIVNRMQNNMWDTGVAFFGSKHHRAVCYNEVQDVLAVN